MKKKNNRRLKVYAQSNGYNYQEVPSIILKGKWLETAGFDIGTELVVECEKGRLIIKAIDRRLKYLEID